MTKTEFDGWAQHYFCAFPGTWAWLMQNSPDIEATLDTWYSVLGRLELGLVTEATERLIDGRAEPPKAYERDLTHHHVKAVAHRILDERARAAENAKLLAKPGPEPAPARGWSCARLYRTLCQLWEKARKRFEDEPDQKRWVYAEMDGQWPDGSRSPSATSKESDNGRF